MSKRTLTLMDIRGLLLQLRGETSNRQIARDTGRKLQHLGDLLREHEINLLRESLKNQTVSFQPGNIADRRTQRGDGRLHHGAALSEVYAATCHGGHRKSWRIIEGCRPFKRR